MKGLQWLITTIFILVPISVAGNATAEVDRDVKPIHLQHHGHLMPARAIKTIHNCYSASLQRKLFFSEKKKKKKHHSFSTLSKHKQQQKRSVDEKTKIQTLYICSTTKGAHSSKTKTATKNHHRHLKHHKQHHKKPSAHSSRHHHKHKHSNKKEEHDNENSGTKKSASTKKHKHHTKLTVHHNKSLSVTKINKKIHQTRETSTTTKVVDPTVLPSAIGYNGSDNESENGNSQSDVHEKKQAVSSSASFTSSADSNQGQANEDNAVNENQDADSAEVTNNDNGDDNDDDNKGTEEEEEEEEEVNEDTTSPSSVDLTSAALPNTSTTAPPAPPVDDNNQVTAQTVQNGQAIDNEPHSKVIGVSVGAVVGCLAAAGLAGMFIYKRKQRSDQEQNSDGINGSRDSRWNGDDAAPVNTRWRTQSFLAVVAGAVAKLPNRSNSSSSSRSGGGGSIIGSIRRAASQASRSLSIRSASNSSLKRTSSGQSSVQSYGIAVSGPMPPIVRVDGDQAHYYAEPDSPASPSSIQPQHYNQVYHTHAY